MSSNRGGVGAARALVMLCGLVACGGDGATTPVADDEPAADGRILVANETAAVLEVAYLREDEADGPRIVRTEVLPGTTADVSGGETLLPGGAQIELDLVLAAGGDGERVRVRRKANVTVDGETIVTVRRLDAEDPFSVEVAVGASRSDPGR